MIGRNAERICRISSVCKEEKKTTSYPPLTPAFKLGRSITIPTRASALTSGYYPPAYHIESISHTNSICNEKKTLSLISLTPAFRLGTHITTLPPGFSPDLGLLSTSLSYWKHKPQQPYL